MRDVAMCVGARQGDGALNSPLLQLGRFSGVSGRGVVIAFFGLAMIASCSTDSTTFGQAGSTSAATAASSGAGQGGATATSAATGSGGAPASSSGTTATTGAGNVCVWGSSKFGGCKFGS